MAAPSLSDVSTASSAPHIARLLHAHWDEIPETLSAREAQALLDTYALLVRAAHRRAAELALDALRREGAGSPPVRFSFLALGSLGREEPSPGSDQDHALILEDYPVARWGEVEPFFLSLSERIEALLTQAGFPPCPGGVSCKNPVWRKKLSEWKEQLRGWCADPTPRAVRQATIFFDFAPIWGDEALGLSLRRHALERIARNQHLVRAMFEEAGSRPTPLGAFGRIRTHRSGQEKGAFDLKRDGLLCLVECARILALRHGIDETSTRGRLDALSRAGALAADEAHACREGFDDLRAFLLETELAALRRGEPAGTSLPDPDRLPDARRSRLRRALEAVQGLRATLHAGYGNVFY